jgi:hypothetical protein
VVVLGDISGMSMWPAIIAVVMKNLSVVCGESWSLSMA